MEQLKIKNVRVIMTAPDGINLIVVKVETNEPEIYGLGCATFTQRHLSVRSAVEDYLKPFLLGKDPRRIEDIWQTSMVSAYWRNGPILNNAISGVDMALWDIKGKLASMPVYDLIGGKCREAAAVYRHTDGKTADEVEENVLKYMEQGYKYLRCQLGGYGGRNHQIHSPENALPGSYYDPDIYVQSVTRLFDHLRERVGFGIELIHDIHERVSPIEAVRLAKQLEPHRLFYLEDALPPEQLDWFKMIRNQSATPLAMGELFVHSAEWMPLITERLIDFIRCHISAIGGLTPAKKLAVLCEAFGIRTAWHGPNDISPVGQAANIHLDLCSPNFGIQEWSEVSEHMREVFPGCPVVRNGFVYVNDKPGLGVNINEELAAKYPCHDRLPDWTLARIPDGTAVRP
jgi:mannonate dehydratase